MTRFLADAMLGKLARKLRMLGLDTAYAARSPDQEIRYRCRAEGRIVLTRDRALAASLGDRALLVEGDRVEEELVSIAPALRGLPEFPEPMTRCLEDNAVLHSILPEDAALSVPPHVFATRQTFVRCPECGRVYWAGSHAERMEGEVANLRRLIGEKTGR